MRNELVEIISRWDQSEPLVDHLLKNGVGVLCKNPKTNFEKLKAMSVERLKSKVNRLKRYDEERDIRLHARLIATAKSEAYKEFAERLLRKATIMRDEPQTNGVVRVGHIYETLEEMGLTHDT